MKAWFRRLLFVVAFSLIFLCLLFWLLTDSVPLVGQKPTMNFQDLQRAQTLWKTYQPSKLEPGRRYIISLSYRDLDLLALLAAAQSGWVSDTNLGFRAQNEHVAMQFSYPIPVGIWHRYLNTELIMDIEPGVLPRVVSTEVSGYQIPSWLQSRLTSAVINRLSEPVISSWQESRVELAMLDQGVSLAFTWRPDWMNELPMLSQTEDPQLALVALNRLKTYLQQHPESPLQLESMLQVLLPGLTEPEQTSVMLTVLVHYVAGSSISDLFALDVPDPEPRVVHLSGRRDMARHFLFSAMLAARTGAEAAEHYGYLKELSDADHRSTGFSGLDLLANQAGIRFYQRWSELTDTTEQREFLAELDNGLLPNKSVLNELELEPRSFWEDDQIDRLLADIPVYQIPVTEY